jgi:predicted dehydrogenase
MSKLKVGQIGVCHEHAEGKMISLKRLPQVFDIVGVVDERPTSTVPRFIGGPSEIYDGIPRMTEEELLATPGLDAVAVEVPNGDLVPTALRVMERGLPMHMDKPGGEDMGQFRTLIEGCREKALPFQIGYMFRANPAFQFCLKAVREGWLGEVFEIQASMSHNYGDDRYQEYLGSYSGGIMFNLGCHFIDFVVAMMGRPTGITPFLRTAGPVEKAGKNNCLTILEYPKAMVTLRACSYELNGIPNRRLKICGTKGSIDLCPLERFDGTSLSLQLTLAEAQDEYAAGIHTVDFGVREDRYEEQMLELAALIRGEATNPYSYDHDLLAQEVVLAASGYTKWN